MRHINKVDAMYPFLRLLKEILVTRNQPALGLWDTHVSYHMCWPWDLDGFLELNNGRTLTLFDLGRLPLARRAGLLDVLRLNRWGLTMAGAVVRYRRRVRAFQKVSMRSRAVCFDARFVYIEQSMWAANGDCTSHVVYRAAVTDSSGIVAPTRVMEAMGHTAASPVMPDWLAAWIRAEDLRPWPPMQDASQE